MSVEEIEIIQAPVTRKRAIELHCHECMGHYSDGVQDCECVRCPLYSYMPYAKLTPLLDSYNYNPRRKGLVFLSAPDPERSERARERFHGGKNLDEDETDEGGVDGLDEGSPLEQE